MNQQPLNPTSKEHWEIFSSSKILIILSLQLLPEIGMIKSNVTKPVFLFNEQNRY